MSFNHILSLLHVCIFRVGKINSWLLYNPPWLINKYTFSSDAAMARARELDSNRRPDITRHFPGNNLSLGKGRVMFQWFRTKRATFWRPS